MTDRNAASSGPHIPVLLKPLLEAVAPVSGRWLDGTFGAGGYTRGLLAAGADHVTGVDRDPLAFDLAKPWIDGFAGRITLQAGVFSRMDEYASDLDGVVLDLGVSSMQLDLAERGFSFMKEGPAGHAYVAGWSFGGGSGGRADRSAAGRHYFQFRRRTRQPPHRQGYRERARRGADHHDPATGRNRCKLPAAPQAEPVASCDPYLSGAADCRER